MEDTKRELLLAIRGCRRKLNRAGLLKKLMFSLGIGAGVGITFQVIALLVPFYSANLYTGLALGLAVCTALAVAYVGRSSMEQAALVMDSFGFQERVITAYEHLDEDSGMVRLQRADAMQRLKADGDRIQIPLWPSWKKLVLLVGMFALLAGLVVMPSASKERAEELHRIREEAKEKEEEIKEVLKELDELATEELTPEEMATLQEMMESLQASIQEYQQAASAQDLVAAGEKLNYKYGNMSSQMSSLAQSLQNGATASPVTAQSMQAMADQLQRMSGNASGQGMASNQGQNGQNGQNGQGGNGGQSGQSGTGTGGEGSGTGTGGEGGGTGTGGEGNGTGTGGEGSSTGTGGGGGGEGGEGNGTGGGRGTGSSNTLHDYVSVPNNIADSENLTGNAVDHNSSDYFRAQNGLSWEGTHMSHEAVIGSYEQNAYEGIAKGRYPSGMENVIKDYFASFN